MELPNHVLYIYALWTKLRTERYRPDQLEDLVLSENLCYSDRAYRVINNHKFYRYTIDGMQSPTSRQHFRPTYKVEHLAVSVPEGMTDTIRLTYTNQVLKGMELFCSDDMITLHEAFNLYYHSFVKQTLSCYGKTVFCITPAQFYREAVYA